MARDEAVDAIADGLTPLIGAEMARAATRDQCRRLGLGDGSLDDGQLEALLARMGRGLELLVGRELASRAMQRARTRLGRAEA